MENIALSVVHVLSHGLIIALLERSYSHPQFIKEGSEVALYIYIYIYIYATSSRACACPAAHCVQLLATP